MQVNDQYELSLRIQSVYSQNQNVTSDQYYTNIQLQITQSIEQQQQWRQQQQAEEEKEEEEYLVKLSYITSIDTCMCRIDKRLQCTNEIYSLHSDHNKSHTLSFPHMTLCLPPDLPVACQRGSRPSPTKPRYLHTSWSDGLQIQILLQLQPTVINVECLNVVKNSKGFH